MTKILATLNVGRDVLNENARQSFVAAARRWGANYLEITSRAGDPGQTHHYYQKTQIDKHLPDNSRVVYFDADMLIRSDCPSPFDVVPQGMFGMVRFNHPSHLSSIQHAYALLDDYRKKTGYALDPDLEYPHTGILLFDLPLHRPVFSALDSLIRDHGFDSRWQISDQVPYGVAVRLTQTPVFWLPAVFNFTGDALWWGWTPEMKTWVYHFCGKIDPAMAIPRTGWNVLGSDRKTFGTDEIRWEQGKPVFLGTPKNIPLLVREFSAVHRGVIVEVGAYLGGATWLGGQIARDNYSTYHVVDSWSSKSPDLYTSDNSYRGFVENMVDAGLADFVEVHRDLSTKAAINFTNGSVDLVYIDADHSYAACLADIRAYWPKLKMGGTMMGHDYCDEFSGVISAVEAAFGGVDEIGGGRFPIWIVRKNDTNDASFLARLNEPRS